MSEKHIEIHQTEDKQVVKLPPHYLLSSGRVVPWVPDSGAYLLVDVKKGDEVQLCVGTVDKERGEECFYIIIRKRPSGRVPPARKLSDFTMYHLDQQAKIDHKEKGTPLPDHLKPKPIARVPSSSPPAPPPQPSGPDRVPDVIYVSGDDPAPKGVPDLPAKAAKYEPTLPATAPKANGGPPLKKGDKR